MSYNARPKSPASKRKNRLKENAVLFKEKVNPEELLPHLTCLTNSVKERFMRKQCNDGAPSAAYQLSLELPKYDNWFEQLIPALREISLNSLADLLDDPNDDPQGGHPGDRQNGPQPDPDSNPGNNRQAGDQGIGARHKPHRPNNQGASGYPTVQNEEQATAETRLPVASSEVLKRQNVGKAERVTGDTLYRQLPATALEVLRQLDVPSNISGNDWKGLAGYLGYSIESVERLKLEKSPTEALLMEWGNGEKTTLHTLMAALKTIKREDIRSQLQKKLGFGVEGFDQVPRPQSTPTQSLPSAGNLAWADDVEAKVEIKNPHRMGNEEQRDRSSSANRTAESVADGDKQQESLTNGNKRNAGSPGSDIKNSGSSDQIQAKKLNKDCLVTDQACTGRGSGCFEVPCAPICAGNDGKKVLKSETSVNKKFDQDIKPEDKDTASESGSIMPVNDLNRNPLGIMQNITSDQSDSASEPKPQNHPKFVEDNLRESDQQSSNMKMSNRTKMAACDAGAGGKNIASDNYNLDRPRQAAHQSFSGDDDENYNEKILLSQPSLASTTSSSNDDMNTLYSITGPDDIFGSLKTPNSLDNNIDLRNGMSLESVPSISSDADDNKSLELSSDPQSAAMKRPVSTSTKNSKCKDMPSSSAMPVTLGMSLKSFPSISSDADDNKSLEMSSNPQSAAMKTPVSTSTQNSTCKNMPSSSALPVSLATPTSATTPASAMTKSSATPPSAVPTLSATPSPSAVPTLSSTPSSSAVPTLSATPSPSVVPTLSATPSSSAVPTLSATPSPSATSTSKASIRPVIPKPDTRAPENPHNATHVPKSDKVQKSMKGTPITQPAQVPVDVPGDMRTPSVDGTFSEDSLMNAITPGKMLRQSQTGKILQPSYGDQQAAGGTQRNPHNTQHHLPSHHNGTHSTPTSPRSKDYLTGDEKQAMSEDHPTPECQENAAPVPPEMAIEEGQGRSFLGSVVHAGPAVLSFVSALQSGYFAP